MRKILPKWISKASLRVSKASLRVKLSLLFPLLILLSLILVNLGSEGPSQYQFFTGSKNIEKQQEQKRNQKIEQIFKADIPKLQGLWSVVVKDLKTGKSYTYNENELIPAASVYKLTVMWAVFEQVEKGAMKLDDPVANTNVENALKLMITISDNDSAIALAEKIGWGKIHRAMESQGIIGFDLVKENGPYTTAKAPADLLERVYKNTAVSPEASEQMQQLLFNQRLNDRIPKYLPEDIKVGHKTGEIDNFRHDAAIVFGKKGDYIFVFLSQTSNTTQAAETIATLSKKIYDALENKN